jgi:hypothetical protein
VTEVNLDQKPCHETEDNWDVWYGGKGLIEWEVAKTTDFSDWNFDARCNCHFNDLMCWLFAQLHQDLAKRKNNARPASYNELKKHGCVGLNYNSIMIALRTSIK